MLTELEKANQKLLDKRKKLGIKPTYDQPLDRSLSWLDKLLPKQTPLTPPPTETPPPTSTPAAPEAVKHYPSLGYAAIKRNLERAYSLWLLLRFLDSRGAGWVYANDVKGLLSAAGAYSIGSKRRYNQVLSQGDGILWDRFRIDGGPLRIGIKGAAKVAIKLELNSLSGRPVKLPIENLLSGFKILRASLVNALHSSRKNNNPISRETIREITGASERSQREYDHVLNCEHTENFAISQLYTKERIQSAHCDRAGVFSLYDKKGLQGPKNNTYIAHRLPNTYRSIFSPSPRGRMRKINGEINLVKKETQGKAIIPIFYNDVKRVSRAINQGLNQDVYYNPSKSDKKTYVIWSLYGGK